MVKERNTTLADATKAWTCSFSNRHYWCLLQNPGLEEWKIKEELNQYGVKH